MLENNLSCPLRKSLSPYNKPKRKVNGFQMTSKINDLGMLGILGILGILGF